MTVISLERNVSGKLENLEPLFQAVRERTGLDLQHYKEKFLHRRVAVRLRATGCKDLRDYLDYLTAEEGEVDRFLLSFTIHVSTFFRNPSTYRALVREVFPELFTPGRPGPVRICSVGCARGEEPYSLAILVSEHLGGTPSREQVQIVAVDVNEKILAEAKAGEYRASQLGDLDPALVEKYFVRNGGYRLVPGIRGSVKFHCRDVFMDPPGSGFDLVLCRNLLIYIDQEPQERVVEGLRRALRPGGYLVLGRTETLSGPAREKFETVDSRERIFRTMR